MEFGQHSISKRTTQIFHSPKIIQCSLQVTCMVRTDHEGNHYFTPENGHPHTITGGRINWWGRDPEWKDVRGFRGKQDVEKPVGEWNTLECIASGDEITVYLNGILVNKATDVRPSKGRIQIQSEAAEVFIRRIELTALTENPHHP